MNEIEEKLAILARVRESIKVCSAKAEELKEKLEKSSEWALYQDALNDVRGLEHDESVIMNDVRIAVNMHFGMDETANKKPYKGIEIKEFSIIKVLDEKKALVWASQNAPSILKLDQTKFKKAVENLELDFVEKGVEYRTQIASDLSEYLK